jgi:hypothetical protein
MHLTDLLQEQVKLLKTLNGSAIKRSKLGVGKDIGGEIYLHKDYEQLIPDQEALKKAKQVLKASYPDFTYNTLKFSKIKFTFFSSPDFDTADEPTAGSYVTVIGDTAKAGKTASIWHHKWLWVQDTYQGFDVEAAYKRSAKWLKLPNIDFSRIGNKAIWERDYVPLIK